MSVENDIFNMNFKDILDQIKFDIIVTDPPYPDYLIEEYNYYDGILDWCKQL